MKIGVQTANILDKLGIEEGFKLIHESGFDCVDFNLNQLLPNRPIAGDIRCELFAKSEADILETVRPYKEAAERYQVAFSQAHAPFPSYTYDEATNEYVMESIRKSIMICGYIGCSHLVVHPFFLGYQDKLSPEQEWQLNIERYAALIDEARKHHVIICLENMFSSHKGRIYGAICSEISEAVRYIDALNDLAGEKRFAFCLDTGHALLATKDIYTAIIELGDRLETLHIHDNDGLNDSHLLPYMGILDWERFCLGLKEIGYQGTLSFETYNALNVFHESLRVECMKLLAATGKLFASKIAQ